MLLVIDINVTSSNRSERNLVLMYIHENKISSVILKVFYLLQSAFHAEKQASIEPTVCLTLSPYCC